MEYVLLPGWQPNNAEHQKLMQMYLYGNGACKTPSIEEDLNMFRVAGFDVVEHFDYMARCEKIYGDECVPWWADLQMNWRFQLLPAHPVIRGALEIILRGLSLIRLVPEDVYKASALLNVGGDGLSGMGKIGAITTQYYVLAVKPLNATKLPKLTGQPNTNEKPKQPEKQAEKPKQAEKQPEKQAEKPKQAEKQAEKPKQAEKQPEKPKQPNTNEKPQQPNTNEKPNTNTKPNTKL